MLISNSPDISIWKTDLSGRDMVTKERLNYGIDAPGALIRDGDARKIDFPDDSFDVAVTSLALHNIREKAERDQVVRKSIRVLKPGGQVANYAVKRISEYRQIFIEPGMEHAQLAGWLYWRLLFCHLLTATKPENR
ncbi:MAG TPA: class I SAM-dependent methyltransferase [Blastocatellia bacterium]|jgi:ubiquinone/menaquinone biosynthesis C-methylase UbiE